MLTLCGRNGFYPPMPCSNCAGSLTQHNSVCRGCHEVLRNLGPDLKVEELSDVKGITRDMPFTYTVYGQLPWSQWDGGQEAALQHTLVRMPDCRSDPLEELLAMMKISEDGPRQATPLSKKQPSSLNEKKSTSSTSKQSSAGPAQVQRASYQSQNKPSSISSSYPSQYKSIYSRVDTKPLSKPSFRPLQAPQSSGAQSKDKKAASPWDRKPTTSSFKRPTGSSKPKKRVWFAPTAQVQYFEKHLAPRAVKRKWRGPDRDFAIQVIA